LCNRVKRVFGDFSCLPQEIERRIESIIRWNAMAMVHLLGKLLAGKTLGKYILPIIPDEARTFGMEFGKACAAC
jgi:pyruvate dehydrogenase complex dehydrogenase (E1) component